MALFDDIIFSTPTGITLTLIKDDTIFIEFDDGFGLEKFYQVQSVRLVNASSRTMVVKITKSGANVTTINAPSGQTRVRNLPGPQRFTDDNAGWSIVRE